ncbi:hypothetical protein R1flu_000069 [Riccia fluitans]|uniref:YbaK/aminoacyl-tRNA synthetase-associated domain-containing protein n=1 Tax=Riccia fluitans TaxID=41844 RepID=A0ABD1Y3J9_9MARC
MDAAQTRDSLLSLLKENGIDSVTYDHPKVLTVDEQAKHVGHLEGGHSKNLLLKDKKNRLILISALTSTKIDMKVLSQRLGLGKSGLRLAPEDIMQAVLKVPLGCVTPFALLNQSARSVTLLLDEGFKSKTQVFFHPLTNDATSAISPNGLDKFLRLIGREPVYVNVEEVVVVGSEQPPDLARYLVDVTGDNISKEQSAIKATTVQGDKPELSQGTNTPAKITVAAPKSKNKSSSAEKETVRSTSADVQGTTLTILNELLSAFQKEVTAQIVEKQGQEIATLVSNPLKQRLEPELESLLMAFKNTAYTEGFVAGMASRSATR